MAVTQLLIAKITLKRKKYRVTISTWQNHFWDINLCFPPYFPFIPVQSRCILSRPFEMSCLRMLCRRNYGECQKTLKTWGLWRSDAMCLGRRKRRALGSKVRERKTFSKLRKETEVEGFRIVRSIYRLVAAAHRACKQALMTH